MRYDSSEGKRFISVQRSVTDKDVVALKTAEKSGGLMDGTWVYLSEKDALKVAAQILRLVAEVKGE